MRYLLILVLGLALGIGGTAFLLRIPRIKSTPGAVVQAPESSGDPPGTVVISFSNSFFELLLTSLFRDLGPPALHLGSLPDGSERFSVQQAGLQQGCSNTITLAQEGS